MNLLIQPKSEHFVRPFLATNGSGGYDLTCVEDVHVPPYHSVGIWTPLGFATAIPKGYLALLLPRSGIGCKKGLALNNTMGVIDSDYRGEWLACLRNHNAEPIDIKRGDRVMQFVLIQAQAAFINEVTELPEPDEVHAGFGSTD